MSNWRFANVPFPTVVKTAIETDPGDDSASMSVDQERALHKWVNDVRHWVQSGRAGSDDEVKAMLAAKGCPSPDDVLAAYHMTKDLQNDDIATEEPQQAGEPEASPVEMPMMPGGDGMMGGPPPQDMGGMMPPPGMGGGEGMPMPDMPPGMGGGGGMPPELEAPPEDMLEPDNEEEERKQRIEDQDDYAIDPRLQMRSTLDDHVAATFGHDNFNAESDEKEHWRGQHRKEEEHRYHDKDMEDRQDRDEDDDEFPHGFKAAMVKGSPYPENSEKNAPDHSAPGHHLPKKVNSIYNAIMREHPDYGKEKAMKIAWERSGLHHEKKKESFAPGTRASYNQVEGTVTQKFMDTWGIATIRLATEYGTFDIPEESATALDPVSVEQQESPSSEVTRYLSEIDPAGSTLASVEARIANIKNAMDFCVEKIGRVSIAEEMKLDKISLDCRLELGELANARKSAVFTSGEAYLQTLPKYAWGEGMAAGGAELGHRPTDGWMDQTYDQMQEEQNGFNGDAFVNEQAPLFVSEIPNEMVGDASVVAAAARDKAFDRVAYLPAEEAQRIIQAFVEAVEDHRRTRLASVKTEMKKSASAEFVGPDEALFM